MFSSTRPEFAIDFEMPAKGITEYGEKKVRDHLNSNTNDASPPSSLSLSLIRAFPEPLRCA